MICDGKVLIDTEFEEIKPFCDGLAGVRKGEMWGYIDYKGTEIIPCEFEEVGYFSEGFAWVKKDGFLVLIDKHGKCITQPLFWLENQLMD